MSDIVNYLDGTYSDRLLIFKIDIFQIIVAISDPDITDEEATTYGQRMWQLYVTFMNDTCKDVAEFDRDDEYDTEDRHVNMMTDEYIMEYIGHNIFTKIITLYKELSKSHTY